MRVDILSLFPNYFRGPFDESMIKRAREAGLVDIHQTDIRDFAEGPHRRVDDRPYGGGPGMVMMPGPTSKAIRKVRKEGSRVIYLSPQGEPLNAAKCRELALEEHLVLLCGHYEGIDQRVIDQEVDEEISIGDFVLTDGCLAAMVLLNATIRFIPGVLGHGQSAEEDSFENGLLDCPHYTRPPVFEEKAVPEVLLSGHHAEIQQWRLQQGLERTKNRRPDLYAGFMQKS